jgi:ABC-type dipeptide/oligopeptide/nickel transport system permease subunit
MTEAQAEDFFSAIFLGLCALVFVAAPVLIVGLTATTVQGFVAAYFVGRILLKLLGPVR